MNTCTYRSLLNEPQQWMGHSLYLARHSHHFRPHYLVLLRQRYLPVHLRDLEKQIRAVDITMYYCARFKVDITILIVIFNVQLCNIQGALGF